MNGISPDGFPVGRGTPGTRRSADDASWSERDAGAFAGALAVALDRREPPGPRSEPDALNRTAPERGPEATVPADATAAGAAARDGDRPDPAGDAAGARDAGTDGAPAAASSADGEEASDASERDASILAGAAAVAATAATRAIDRDPAHLDPAFRARLTRVIQRMRDEFGHEVRIVEGLRTQARQDALYAQGRTAAGPVVTWTRASAHVQGRAADLLVDGRYDDPEAYARLARIAREEGLRVLGPGDAAHVELPVDGSAAAEAPSRTSSTEGAAGRARVARVAAVAPVAAMAPVARVARVADIAAPAAVHASVIDEHGTADHGRHDEREPGTSARVKSARTSAESSGSPSRSQSAGGESARAAAESGAEQARQAAAIDAPRAARGAEPIDRPGAVAGGGGAERVGRILELREAADTRPLSRVLLRLDPADGGPGRIRVDLRGTRVGADITVADPAAADRIDSGMDALHRALRSRGLDPDVLRVQASGAAVHRGELPAAAARAAADVAPAAPRLIDLTSEGDGTFRRPAGEQHHAPRREPDAQYHRSRREQNREETP